MLNSTYQGFIWGQIFLGGDLHIYLYVRMYIHTCVARRGVAWRKHDVVYSMILKNHTHACSMHIRFSFRIMMKMKHAMAKYSDVCNGGQICMWNDSGLN